MRARHCLGTFPAWPPEVASSGSVKPETRHRLFRELERAGSAGRFRPMGLLNLLRFGLARNR